MSHECGQDVSVNIRGGFGSVQQNKCYLVKEPEQIFQRFVEIINNGRRSTHCSI